MYLIAIDYSKSEEKPNVLFSIVVVDEKDYHSLKEFLMNKIDIKQWKKLGKKKTTYQVKLIESLKDCRKSLCLKDLCVRLRSYEDLEILFKENFTFITTARFIFIDDTIFTNKKFNKKIKSYLKNLDKKVLKKESIVKNTMPYYYPLIMLADNIANLSRIKKILKWK